MIVHELKAKRQGYRFVLGIDEAGRGPLAGPVVASAVALHDFQFENKICDSKKLSAAKREKAFHEIFAKAYVGIGIASESVIDSQNILQSTFLAMANAVRDLIASLPQEQMSGTPIANNFFLLVDGNRFKTDLPYPYQTIVEGEDASLSIAAASIVAKVTRDRILNIYDKVFPEYGFGQHKGYGTREHRKALMKFGPSPIHRRSFQFHASRSRSL
jgi:ribonuclease HII